MESSTSPTSELTNAEAVFHRSVAAHFAEAPILWSDAPADERIAAGNFSYCPVCYSEPHFEYQNEYLLGNGVEVLDLSLILRRDGKAVGLWPVTLQRSESGFQFASHTSEILPPRFHQGIPQSTEKRLIREAMECLMTSAAELKVNALRLSSAEFVSCGAMSEWEKELLAQGAGKSVFAELFLDLSPDWPDIKASFRKSYKSLINSGLKEWNISIDRDGQPTSWNELMQLHFSVAGRQTRSAQSWEIQRKMIQTGVAFVVYLKDSSGRMVGGGFFQTTRDEALYAVGVYDRSLFHKPLGHAVQAVAIQEMKLRGIKWYKLGRRFLAQDLPAPTEKEIAIAEFKSGFASHWFPKIEYQIPTGYEQL